MVSKTADARVRLIKKGMSMNRSWGVLGGLAFFMVSSAVAQERSRLALPSDESLQRYGLVRAWYGFAPVDGKRETVENASVVGNQIHLQTNQSRIHVLDAESGKLLWSTQLGQPQRGQHGSAFNSNSVFAVSGSSLYRLNRTDGSHLWTIRMPQVPSAAPAADEQRVVVSTVDGRVYVYDIETHDVVWFFQTDGEISMPAVLYDEKVACASRDGVLYVFGKSSRNPLHRYKTDAPVSAPIATWGRLVLVPSQDFSLYAVDIRSGDTQWRYTFGTEIHRPIRVIENQLFVSPDEGGVYVLRPEDGTELWRHLRSDQFVAASRNRVYADDKYGRLTMLERTTGRVLNTWDTHNFDFRVVNESNDRLYLATRTGLVVCCREKENKEPVVHKKATPPPARGAAAKPEEPAEGQAKP